MFRSFLALTSSLVLGAVANAQTIAYSSTDLPSTVTASDGSSVAVRYAALNSNGAAAGYTVTGNSKAPDLVVAEGGVAAAYSLADFGPACDTSATSIVPQDLTMSARLVAGSFTAYGPKAGRATSCLFTFDITSRAFRFYPVTKGLVPGSVHVNDRGDLVVEAIQTKKNGLSGTYCASCGGVFRKRFVVNFLDENGRQSGIITDDRRRGVRPAIADANGVRGFSLTGAKATIGEVKNVISFALDSSGQGALFFNAARGKRRAMEPYRLAGFQLATEAPAFASYDLRFSVQSYTLVPSACGRTTLFIVDNQRSGALTKVAVHDPALGLLSPTVAGLGYAGQVVDIASDGSFLTFRFDTPSTTSYSLIKPSQPLCNE